MKRMMMVLAVLLCAASAFAADAGTVHGVLTNIDARMADGVEVKGLNSSGATTKAGVGLGGDVFTSGLSEYAGALTFERDAGVTNAVDAISTQPTSGARTVSVGFFDTDTSQPAAATLLYVVFNSSNSTTADVSLDSMTGSQVVALGERRTFIFEVGSECTTIFYKTNTAIGADANLVTVEYVQ